ncbi:MAG: hypothetical protein IPL99_15705 [Candidatus Competibacteraceae bacterium]|nr:hypothetical protein [Candidatus Competibacteraceae bacterium]
MNYDRIFGFALSDLDSRATVRDQFYGLLRLNGEAKPSYTALSRLLAITGGVLQPAAAPNASQLPAQLQSSTWLRQNNSRVWLFWAPQDGNAQLTEITRAVLHDLRSNALTVLTAKNNVLTVPVKTTLQVLEIPVDQQSSGTPVNEQPLVAPSNLRIP